MPTRRKVHQRLRTLTKRVTRLERLLLHHLAEIQVSLNYLMHQTQGAEGRARSTLRQLDDLEEGG